jgi:hypothetical protein
MNIEFSPKVIGEEQVTNLLNNFFFQICGNEFDNLIDRYIITEEEVYESVVKQVDSTATVTNNDEFVGVAKTIFHTNSKKSTIIIKTHQLIPIFEGINSHTSINSWSQSQLNALFTTLHEFGHARDNITRPHEGLNKPNRPFRLKQVCDYYHHILLCEIGANICAQTIIPSIFRIIGRDDEIGTIYTSHTKLLEFINTKSVILDENSCFNIIGMIAAIILKIQEVYLHRFNENELVKGYFNPDDKECIVNWLNTLEKEYPDWQDTKDVFFNLNIQILNSFRLRWEIIDGIEIIRKI